MPSNAEYTKQAEELAEKLDIKIDTAGLNNEKLANLVSDLKAKARDAEIQTQADQNGAPPPPAPTDEEAAKAAEEAEKLPPYSVAKGKALTTKRGIVSDGQEVTAAHLAGGQQALDAFVKSGHVVKA